MHTIRPIQQCRNKLKNLKLLWIRPVQSKEVQEVICNNLPVPISVDRVILGPFYLPIDVVLRFTFLEVSQCFGEMIV